MGRSDHLEGKGWFHLLKRESESRNCPVVIMGRGGNKSPIFRAENGQFIGKIHCSGKPDRSDNRIWADFPEEMAWLNQYPNVKVIGIWLDIDESNPSQENYSEERDNFVPVPGADLEQKVNSQDALNIIVESRLAGHYQIKNKPARTNDWDVIFG